MIAIGKDIVKKCVGVPLAVRTTGSLLYSRNLGLSDWQYFRDVEFSKIDHQKDKIFAILKLSYDHLPSFLKNCFAYCSLFPKDFEFDKKTLIQLWVAEGFIQPSDDIRCVEDVGYEYFMNLLSMSFFQDVILHDTGEIMKCKMHAHIHDLALLVAGKEYAVIAGKEVNIEKRTRHLSYHVPVYFAPKLSSYLVKGNKLRTFLFPSQPLYPRAILDQSDFASLLSLKFLRVLNLCRLNIISIPNSIKELMHLRYVDLSQNFEFEILPRDITSLHNLQTLKLSRCFRLTELPADINKMISLRHLELHKCDRLICMPRGLGQLTCLQTLTTFMLNSNRAGNNCGINELGGLNNLRGGLCISRLHYLRCNATEVAAKVLLEKQHLRELELWWGDDDLDKGSEDERILQRLQPHHAIKRLVIGGFCGKRLPDWIGNISSLLVLEIKSCNGLTSLPEGMKNLRSLQKLSIFHCSLLELKCTREWSEEWPKIAHIPKVLMTPIPPYP